MTSLSENKHENDVNIDSKQCATDNEQSSLQNDASNSINIGIHESINHDQKQDEIHGDFQGDNLTLQSVETNIAHGNDNNDTLINTSPPIVTINGEQHKEVNEFTENHRSKKTFNNTKVKYSTMPYHRSSFYTNGHAYGTVPYYYYSLPSLEKPTPLMFIPNQQRTSTSPSPSSRENQTGNSSSIVSPQNLPPRLRQTSAAETESNSQVPSTTSQPLPPPPPTTTMNGRRHRSILPRGLNNYYPHPPPLMATPPGVLYPYPPAVHQPGHIAYNIRVPDELELYAYHQQQLMNLPPSPVIWSSPPTALPPHGHPSFVSYAMNGLPPTYLFNQSIISQPTNSFLNPDAVEWVPSQNDHDSPSSDHQILIDDEINFPPLNSTTTNNPTTTLKDHLDDNSEQNDISSETILTNDNQSSETSPIPTDNSNILISSEPKIDSSNNISSSQEDNHNNKSLSSSTKVAPVTYSTIISQISDNQNSTKTQINNQKNQQIREQSSTNHVHNQLPPRERTNKHERSQMNSSSSSSNIHSRRRQPFNNNNNNRIPTRNLLPTDPNSLSKQQQQQQQSPIVDDWIEVKSKKTKKFDRNLNDSSTEKFLIDEQIHKSVSPSLSLTSTGDNTTATFTSEDDYDEKDNQDLVIIINNDVTNDYNQTIIDEIHNRLDNNERLLIIMRGCPGSGKSTLAKSLNHGYNGVILSTDDYFTDRNLNKYVFDLNKLDDAHRYNRRRASDALKRNVSPVIIDNTNTQTWEIKPYVAMGKEAGYDILLIEPQTPWRYKARDLFKRNRHNLPLRRIHDMLNRFEHNVTVQNILDQLASATKSTNILSSEQDIRKKDKEIIDPILTSKKFYDIIDDSLILNDVRLCINDMILFLTSNFYQTTLLSSSLTLPTTTTTTATTSPTSTPLSVSFHDLSLISSSPTTTSLPSTPSTPHSRFHRTFTRFSSTTNQDHSFNTEHLLRLPNTTTSTYSRCLDTTNLTPPLSAQSSLVAKKRRKNKNKQPSNELILNTNNNNNNNNNQMDINQECLLQQPNFQVFLPDDYVDFIVIDDYDDNNSMDIANKNFDQPNNLLRDYSSTIPCKQTQYTTSDNQQLLNILHNEFNKPSNHPSVSTKHIGIQCSSNNFHSNSSDLILIGCLSSSIKLPITPSISPRPGYNECGIQVDLNDNQLDALIETYANRLSLETIRQFYDDCHENIQWTRTQLDAYLLQQDNGDFNRIRTLRQLCLNTLNQWNEQIKSYNPLFDSKSIDDLLADITDNEILEDISTNKNDIELTESKLIHIPWSIISSLEQLYGELPNKSLLSSNHDSVSLVCDDDLSRNIYQGLQRFVNKSNPVNQPMVEKKKKMKTKTNPIDQKWKLPSDEQPSTEVKTNDIPSLKQIISEQQQQVASCQKLKQKCQLDYASEYKLKELEGHFPSFDSDLLYDILRENEYNYDITYICILTMLDEHASITTIPQSSQSISSSRSLPTNKIQVEPVHESYESLRYDALRHGQQRKEFYAKAHQANRYGMSGVASYYIHRASEETQLIKEANRIAGERLSQWRLTQFYQTHQLDLHGLHSDEALNLFKQIENELCGKVRRTTPKSIEIITGYGKNSIYGAGGHRKIRSVILTYLQQRNYKYSEPNKGVILLQLINAKN